MFAVLVGENYPDRLRGFRGYWHKKHGRPCVARSSWQGIEYWVIDTETGKRKYRWENIEEFCQRVSVLAAKDVRIPQDCRLRLYDSRQAQWDLLLRAAGRWARSTTRKLSDILFAVVDWDGRYTDTVRQLIRTCLTVKVVTLAQETYRELYEELMETCGASILVGNSLESCRGCTAVLAPDGLRGTLALDCPVFGARETEARRGAVSAVEIENVFGPQLPGEVAPLEFLAALQELENYQPSQNVMASRLCCDGVWMGCEEAWAYFHKLFGPCAAIPSRDTQKRDERKSGTDEELVKLG